VFAVLKDISVSKYFNTASSKAIPSGILVSGPRQHQYLDWPLLVLRMHGSVCVGWDGVHAGFIKLANYKMMLYAYM